MRFLWLVAGLLVTELICAQTNFPGGVYSLTVEKLNNEMPEVKFGLQDPVVIENSDSWEILVGLDLDLLPGQYVLYFKHAGADTSGEHKTLEVQQRVYPFTEVDNENLQQSQLVDEYAKPELSGISFSNTQQPTLPMRLPAQGEWSQRFGHRWLIAKQQDIQVSNAISLWAPQYSSVIAPQNAIVSNIVMNEQDLAAVVLDHGRGLYSILRGLTDLTVDVGNGVVAGAVLGRLPSLDPQTQQGKLVWQTMLNGVFVDPNLLIDPNELSKTTQTNTSQEAVTRD